MKKKDTFNAKLSFIISLFSVIPLLNFGICIVAIYMSIRSLKLIYAEPKKFGGLVYAYIALAISFSMLIVSVIFMVIYFQRKLTCDVVLSSDLF